MQATAFKSIMGSFPSGVSVVTAIGDDGKPRGLTCSSLCSVSLHPPMLLVCVSKGSETLHVLRPGSHFVVNMLRDDAEEVARSFASRSDDKFAQLAWRPALHAAGAPILEGKIVAHAECRIAELIEAGDHCILLGEVQNGEMDPDHLPLVYLRKRFETLGGHARAE